MEKSGMIRLLCVGMIAAVIVLSLLMAVAVCGGIPLLGEEDDTVRKGLGFYDLLGEDPTGPPPFVDTVDWENMTMPPETTEGDGTLPVEPGMDDKAELDADLMDTPILEVEPEVDGDIYLKMQSYGDYTGQGWTEAGAYGELLDGMSADFLVGSMLAEQSDMPVSSLGILPLMEFSVLPYYAYRVEGDIPVSDVKIEGNTEGAFLVWYYPVEEIPDGFRPPKAYRDYELALRNHAYSAYLNVDGETLDYMQRIIDEQGFSADDPDIIEQVAEYIRGAAVYNLEFDETMETESNVVIAFLEHYKEGVCRHYAAAATLLFRSLGIPARYTVGFHAEGSAGRTTVVKGSDAHAWVEVYVDGLGWQKVEVTGSSDEQPDRPVVELQLPDVELLFNDEYQPYPTDQIRGFEEYEAMGYRFEVTVYPSELRIGKETVYPDSVQIFDPDGKDVTKQFDVRYDEERAGTFMIYHELNLDLPEQVKLLYNGASQPYPTDQIRGFELYKSMGYVLLPGVFPSVLMIGKETVSIDFVTVYNKDGTDVTEQFRLVGNEEESGTFMIYHEVDLKLPDVYLPYSNGMNLSYPTEQIEGFEFYERMGYRYELGEQPVAIPRGTAKFSPDPDSIRFYDSDNKDVTEQFRVTCEAGSLTIYHDPIVFNSNGKNKIYDGAALTVEDQDIRIARGSLPAGYSVSIVPVGSLTDVGWTNAKFNVRILYTDSNGKTVDATADFTRKCYFGEVDEEGKPIAYVALTKNYGKLEVKPRPITLKTASATISKTELNQAPYYGVLTAHAIESIIYSGDPDEAGVLAGALAEGHYVDMDALVFTGSLSAVGKRVDNTIDETSIVIRNAAGENVTKNYTPASVAGILRVSHK